MTEVQTKTKVIVFTCNWQAFSSLEAAGRSGLAYSTAVVPIRLSCLGRISPGLILKAFQAGAAGVCLLGCPEGECRYLTGNEQAQAVFRETRELLKLLGYSEETLQYQLIAAEDGERCVEILDDMLQAIMKDRSGS